MELLHLIGIGIVIWGFYDQGCREQSSLTVMNRKKIKRRKKMSDQEFEDLKMKIEAVTEYLWELQRQYKAETGQTYQK